MMPLQVLLEEPGVSSYPLPEELEKLYGGGLGFPEQCLYANFVASVDGVVAVPPHKRSSSLISGGSEADRLVMALLRACAEVVLIGAGTLRDHPDTVWTAQDAYREAAGALAELRGRLNLNERPHLAVVSECAEIEPDHPGLQADTLVLTGASRARALARRLPSDWRVVSVGELAPFGGGTIMEALRAEGYRIILTEGGPILMGHLLDAGVVDQLFLTVSPLLAGRSTARRPGLVEQVELLPDRPTRAALLSLRSHGSYLFARYHLAPPAPPGLANSRADPVRRRLGTSHCAR